MLYNAKIAWVDNPDDILDVIISTKEIDDADDSDDEIFYYFESVEEIEKTKNGDPGINDFILLSYEERADEVE